MFRMNYDRVGWFRSTDAATVSGTKFPSVSSARRRCSERNNASRKPGESSGAIVQPEGELFGSMR